MLLYMQHLGQGEVLSGLMTWPAMAERPTSHSAVITDLLAATAVMAKMPAQSVQVRSMNAPCVFLMKITPHDFL